MGSTLWLENIDGHNGFKIEGMIGTSVSGAGDINNGAGDINGDGVSDAVFGSNLESSVYVIFGTKQPFAKHFNINNLDGHNGFKIIGADGLGYSVSGINDINMDGMDDIIISDDLSKAYVLFGSNVTFGPIVNISSLNGNNGFVITGAKSTGLSVREAGDVNGDGLSDILLGDSKASSAYVVFGRTILPSIFNITNLNGHNGFVITGVNSEALSISGAGDVNGDGLSDILLGDSKASSAYVVFGRSSFSSTINVNNLHNNTGFIITGDNNLGSLVSRAGDINGDGLSDIMIASDTATAYVIFGSKSNSTNPFNVNEINATNGFKIVQGAWPYLPPYPAQLVINEAGDVNGDGYDDVIFANAAYSPDLIKSAGIGYMLDINIIFGSNVTSDDPFYILGINGKNGFAIQEEYYFPKNTIVPSIISSKGNVDINGDGYSDIMLSYAIKNDTYKYSGNFIAFGKSDWTHEENNFAQKAKKYGSLGALGAGILIGVGTVAGCIATYIIGRKMLNVWRDRPNSNPNTPEPSIQDPEEVGYGAI